MTICAAFGLTSPLACAEQPSQRIEGAFLQVGEASHTLSVTAGIYWKLSWHTDWHGTSLETYVETSLGRWHIREDGATHSPWISQVGVTPVLRVNFGGESQAWFSELGIGANVLAPLFRENDRRFSTTFNFGDHVAIGRHLDEENDLVLRLQHYSNGGIKHPNPGVNFLQLRWMRRF
ncbi:acyloxyacyl hydrolase [Roseateles agri]|nr:acyloxyacyl hydrolase [Paucibacter sp. R3-3]